MSRPAVAPPPSSAAAIVAVTVVTAPLGLAAIANEAYHGSTLRPVLASADELAMLHRLPRELSAGAVFGNALSGSAYLYGLSGVSVIPSTSFPPDDDDVRTAFTKLALAGEDPTVCPALRRLGVRYVYVDPLPWMIRPDAPEVRAAPPGSRLVDQGGTAKVYEITACG